MSTKAAKNVMMRNTSYNWVSDDIQNLIFNHAVGAQKNISVEPVIKSTYTASDIVPFGSLVKLNAAATSYNMLCLGRAFSGASSYRIGNIVTQGGNIYIANVDIQIGHAFTATEWILVASATISGIPVTGGSTVCVGKYHNAVSEAGFLVEDDSTFGQRR